MKKSLQRWLICTAVCAVVILLAPALLPKTVEVSLSVLLGLWYLGNPVLCVVMGIVAGRHLQEMFLFPLVPPALYAVSVLLLFTWDGSMVLLLGSYLAFGIIAMLITCLARLALAARRQERR